GNRVLRKVRDQLYRHVQYLSLSFHTKAKTGDLVVRVISDVGMLQDVAVTALPLFWLRTVTLTRRIQEIAKKQRRQEGAMAATAAESITASKTVQALSLEEHFARSFAFESDRNLKEDVKGKRL